MPDKPEVVMMAELLGVDQDAVVGKLIRLWIWVDQQTRDGNAISVTFAFLDRITYVTGFATAAQQVGWLTEVDGKLEIPNFGRHNGQTAKKRAETNRRVAKSREKQRKCNANVTVKALQKALQKALPEKRREEYIERVPREGIPGGLTIDEQTRIHEFFKVAGLSGTILNVNAEKRHLYAQNMNFLMDDWERVQANVRPWIKSLDWKSPVTINNIASHLQAIADFKPNGNHSRRNKNSYDRNAGTANADKASDYSKIGRRRDL